MVTLFSAALYLGPRWPRGAAVVGAPDAAAAGRQPAGVEHRDVLNASDWLIPARTAAALAPLKADDRWRTVPSDARVTAWTDNFSNVLGAIKWR